MTSPITELTFDSPDGLTITTGDHPTYPFRLTHRGTAYSDDDFAVELSTSVELTGNELRDLVTQGAALLDDQKLERVRHTDTQVELTLDKDYIQRIAGLFGLAVRTPRGKTPKHSPTIPERIALDKQHFIALVEMMGLELQEDTA